MNKSIQYFARVILLLVFTIPLSQDVWSQSAYLGLNSPDGVTIEWNKPTFDGGELSFLTSTIFVSGSFSLSERITGVVELPVAHSGSKDDDHDDLYGTSIGNPYLGISTRMADLPAWFEIGVRVPLTSGDGWFLPGLVANVERLGSFGEDLFTISGAVNSRLTADPVIFHIRVQPNMLIPTGDNSADSELFANYSAFAWIVQDQVDFGIGAHGWMILTESDLNIGERTIHEGGVAVRVKLDSVHLGFRASVPLDDDMKFLVDSTIGLNVTVPLSRTN